MSEEHVNLLERLAEIEERLQLPAYCYSTGEALRDLIRGVVRPMLEAALTPPVPPSQGEG